MKDCEIKKEEVGVLLLCSTFRQLGLKIHLSLFGPNGSVAWYNLFLKDMKKEFIFFSDLLRNVKICAKSLEGPLDLLLGLTSVKIA